jgi:hypothetical protein
VVCDAVREYRATIVTLQETKLAFLDRALVGEILGSKFVENFVVLLADQTRGGILLAVDEEHYKITSHEVGVNMVTATVTSACGLFSWSLTAVYGSQEDQAKLQFLGELRWLQQSVPDKWLLVGCWGIQENCHPRNVKVYEICEISFQEHRIREDLES